MKGKVFGFIVLTTLGIAVMAYMGWLGEGDAFQVKAHLMHYGCSENNIDMKVNAVGDSALAHLIGKDISPEATFAQSSLREFINTKLKDRSGKGDLSRDFIVIGYIRKSATKHCSGAVCFKVKKIKYEGESYFTEF